MEQHSADRSVLPTELCEEIILRLPPGETLSTRVINTSSAADLGYSVDKDRFAMLIACSANSLVTLPPSN